MYIVHILEGAIEEDRVFWNNFVLWHTVAAHLRAALGRTLEAPLLHENLSLHNTTFEAVLKCVATVDLRA